MFQLVNLMPDNFFVASAIVNNSRRLVASESMHAIRIALVSIESVFPNLTGLGWRVKDGMVFGSIMAVSKFMTSSRLA